MSEFPPLIYVDLIEEIPKSRDELFATWIADGVDINDELFDRVYRKYLDRFQPWRLLVKSGGNHEDMFKSTESYFNKSDAIHAAEVSFGDRSNVYLREREEGNRVLRMAVPL